jgi:DNA-binding MarR family transcriptional regulator
VAERGGLPVDPIAVSTRLWGEHGWADAAPGMAMVTSIARVQQLLAERIDAVLRPLGLSFARYEILMLLSFSRRGTLPMTRMGSYLQVHPTSVTSAVGRLETQQLVLRERLSTDRRTVLARITDAGREAAGSATNRLNTQVFEQPGISLRQVEQLTTVLRAIRANSGDF